MYRSVTEGRFSEALRQVNTILHIIPLTVVDSRREVDEVKELISIARSVLPGWQLSMMVIQGHTAVTGQELRSGQDS